MIKLNRCNVCRMRARGTSKTNQKMWEDAQWKGRGCTIEGKDLHNGRRGFAQWKGTVRERFARWKGRDCMMERKGCIGSVGT